MNHDIKSKKWFLEELRATCCELTIKERFWRRLFYVFLSLIVLLALLAFILRVFADNYWLPIVFSSCMFPAIGFMCFSLYKQRMWQCQVESWVRFMRPMEEKLLSHADYDIRSERLSMKKAIQKWEYLSAYITIDCLSTPSADEFPGMVTGAKIRDWQYALEIELNKLGAEGWELVCINPLLTEGEGDDGFAVFKRPLED